MMSGCAGFDAAMRKRGDYEVAVAMLDDIVTVLAEALAALDHVEAADDLFARRSDVPPERLAGMSPPCRSS
jgi:hypothetical protein